MYNQFSNHGNRQFLTQRTWQPFKVTSCFKKTMYPYQFYDSRIKTLHLWSLDIGI